MTQILLMTRMLLKTHMPLKTNMLYKTDMRTKAQILDREHINIARKLMWDEGSPVINKTMYVLDKVYPLHPTHKMNARSKVQSLQNEPSRSVSEDDEPPLHRKRRAFKEHHAHFLDEVHEQHPQNESALRRVSYALNEVKCEGEHNLNGSGNGPQGDI
ncbi:hypothetical protein BGX21_001937 [Mortierella sp. AD011]|nr:hypothetical protein BGX20_004945 [Mortierella sp. AD010]KAF9382044.1 hypothetical protein BGX21_001937 [Mortierella sp. AD011]